MEQHVLIQNHAEVVMIENFVKYVARDNIQNKKSPNVGIVD